MTVDPAGEWPSVSSPPRVDDEQRQAAYSAIKRRREFVRNVIAFAAISVLLWIIWAITSEDRSGVPWPVWPTLGVAIAAAISAWQTFGDRPISDSDIEREIRRREH
jgi:4-hydroxybenzoate polyprenyltransferase